MKNLGIARSVLAAAVITAGLMPMAHAQEFPSRAITIVVPLAPGSGGDQVVRRLTDNLSRSLGHSIVVDNRPGASGAIAAEWVAKSKPDGYTVMYAGVQTFCVHDAASNAGFEARRDFMPLTLALVAQPLLIVNAGLPVKTFDEFIRYAKSRPGRLNFGSPGEASAQRLTALLLEELTGIEMTHVSYKQGPQVMLDLSAGHLDVTIEMASASLAQLKSGKARALAVVGDRRKQAVPDVPTTSEVGMPALSLPVWTGFVVPRGTPTDVVARLNRDFVGALKAPEFVQWLDNLGTQPMATTPAEFASIIQSDCAQWSRLAQVAKRR